MFNKGKIIAPILSLLTLISIGCATAKIGTAETLAGKYFQARLEYSQLLVIANEYKASPTANPEIVKVLQNVDLRVQEAEERIKLFLENGDFTNAQTNLNLYVALISELRFQLLSRGIIKVEN